MSKSYEDEAAVHLLDHSYQSPLKRHSSRISTKSTDIAAATSFSNDHTTPMKSSFEPASFKNKDSIFAHLNHDSSPMIMSPSIQDNKSIDLDLWIQVLKSHPSHFHMDPSIPRFTLYSDATGCLESVYFEKLGLKCTLAELLTSNFWIHCHEPTVTEMNLLSQVLFSISFKPL